MLLIGQIISDYHPILGLHNLDTSVGMCSFTDQWLGIYGQILSPSLYTQRITHTCTYFVGITPKIHIPICHLTHGHVNLLGPSDAILRPKSGSTLAQVMACWLTAPSHYLNQCWLIISKIWWHSSEGNFIRSTSATIHKFSLKITYLKLNWNLPGANELSNSDIPVITVASISVLPWGT